MPPPGYGIFHNSDASATLSANARAPAKQMANEISLLYRTLAIMVEYRGPGYTKHRLPKREYRPNMLEPA